MENKTFLGRIPRQITYFTSCSEIANLSVATSPSGRRPPPRCFRLWLGFPKQEAELAVSIELRIAGQSREG